MWKDYSSSYIKHNRSSSLAIIVSAFISALLLSLLCGLFYNLWKYEVERIELEKGGWQSQIVGKLDKQAIENIENFANVKYIDIDEKETVINIYFNNYRTVFKDTSNIAKVIGIPSENIVYNYELLAMYMIRDSNDTAPRLLFPFFMIITIMASFSLIVIIRNSFAASMNTRIHQFGIFSSIGATPRQIRICLLQEAFSLCAIPVIIGNLMGIVSSMGLIQLINVLTVDVTGRHKSVFSYHILVLIITLALTIITIWISAWLPAKKLSRLTPLEAIKNNTESQVKRKKSSYILKALFGVEGELAGNALKAQRHALRGASLSLILSFMAFTLMQCFVKTSEISTRETYFERYQDVWDIMITIKNTDINDFDKKIAEIQKIHGIESAVIYQKANSKRIITDKEMSEAVKINGGFSHAASNYVIKVDDGWLVNAPIIILDDKSFLDYCRQIGAVQQLDGAIIRNEIRDVTNPDFRHPEFMPYINVDNSGENSISVLRQTGNEEMAVEIPILSYTEEVPLLREEYATLDYYELVHFMPASLWKEIKSQIGGVEEDIYIRILGKENVSLDELNKLQEEIAGLISPEYILESENRIQEYDTNAKLINGVRYIFGSFCVLLAIIGISNVFSNTMGFVRQRKREFARYMSIGLTPKEIRKMFCVEALTITLRPILITIPLAVLAVWYILKMSYLEINEFLAEAPLVPIVIFMLAILGSVTAAYYLAWRNVRRISIIEVIRDDTMI